MTINHPASPTNPMKIGAPLPPDQQSLFVDYGDLVEELRRAECELVYALARHRKAWQSMARRLDERAELVDKPGGLAAIDSDPIWKKKTGDVQWWRDEVTCQATAVLALKEIIRDRDAPRGIPFGG
jgi:hypothetical protein